MPSSYDQVIYRGLPFVQSHPDRLATLATLFGMQPAPLDRCRVLELGCADGGNLIPMAFEFPGSEFVGLDAAEGVIRSGQEQITDLGLTNIRLQQLDLMDAGAELGSFDYVIAHGLYSWVPVPVRDKLLHLARTVLSPHGVIYISYNALPGCRIREMFRDMMLFHSRGEAEPDPLIASAREFLECFVSAQTALGPAGTFMKDEAEVLLDQSPVVLYHDELAELYDPIYFHQFVSHASGHGLQFLSEANYFDMQPGRFQRVMDQIERFSGGNRILRDQYLDFLKCRKFRQTLLCHENVRLLDQPVPERVAGLYASSSAKAVSAQPNLKTGVEEEFRGLRGAAVKTAHPVAKALMATLCASWPEALAIRDLAARIGQLTGLEPDQGGICEILLATYEAGVTELRAKPPRCVSKPSHFPAATALARWQVQRGTLVTTPRHTTIEVTGDVERRLITLLDGTRDTPTLAQEMSAVLNQPLDAVAKQLEMNLARLAKTGLLTA